MRHQSWRDYCRPIIAKVLLETAGRDETVIKEALHRAYPFGERRRHPYKIWLDEIQVQRETKPDKKHKIKTAELLAAGQMQMEMQ